VADGSGAAVAAEGGATGAAEGAANGTGAAPGAEGAAAAAASTGTPQTPAHWSTTLDADTRGWLGNKQYFGPDLVKADVAKGVAEMVKAHRSMESVMGRNRLAAPKDINDTEAYTAIYKALGHPADKAGYDIKLPEGGNQQYLEGMLDTFHKAGLSVSQAQAIVKASDEFGAAIARERDAAFATQSTAELEQTRKEWGPQADRNFAAAQRFTNTFGIDKPTMEKIERAVGTKTMLGLFSKIGMALTEDRGAGASGSGAMPVSTVEGAKAQLADLRADKGWVQRQQAGGATENRELERLLGIIAEGM
jgi:hypothetical protein